MTLDELVTLILSLGGFSSLLTSVVTRAHWVPWLRLSASIAVSALVGFTGYLSTHDWHVQSVPDLITLIAGIATGSWVTYQSVFKPLGISGAIEKATTPDSVLAANLPPVVAPPVSTPWVIANADHSITVDMADGKPPVTERSVAP